MGALNPPARQGHRLPPAAALALHFRAVCYLGMNYPESQVFTRWLEYQDGYCRSLDVPSRDEVAAP